jgi:O-antigen ligase
VFRRVAVPPADLVTAATGAFLTLSAITVVGRYGTGFGLGLTVGACFFLVLVACFVVVPHVSVAATIVYFVTLPTLKIFVSDLLGGTKDVITFAAAAAALILIIQRRAGRAPVAIDRAVIVLLAFVAVLYLLDIGGNLSGESRYGAAWFHGVRLFAEPLSLLVVGLSLRDPRRTFRWAGSALALSAVVVAAYGIFQQFLGVDRLVALGYRYGGEVRQIGPNLRSFGTLDEPFSYAGFLLLCGAVLTLRGRFRASSAAILTVVAAGLAFSYVRTAAVIVVALLGLVIARRGNMRLAIFVTAGAAAAAAVFFAGASDVPSTRAVQLKPNQYLTLNGRANVWSQALGHSRSTWLLGRGVGAVGTASQRAGQTLTGGKARSSSSDSKRGTIVDSGYLAVATDIGFLGLAIFLALLARLLFLGWRFAAAGASEGWVALGLLIVMLFDALTRESLTGFPTAYIGMLLLGLALARATARAREAQAPVAAP